MRTFNENGAAQFELIRYFLICGGSNIIIQIILQPSSLGIKKRGPTLISHETFTSKNARQKPKWNDNSVIIFCSSHHIRVAHIYTNASVYISKFWDSIILKIVYHTEIDFQESKSDPKNAIEKNINLFTNYNCTVYSLCFL